MGDFRALLEADHAAELLCQRAIVYEWLASLFAAALPASAVESYRSGDGAPFLAALSVVDALQPGIDQMRQVLATEHSTAALTARLGTSFNLLFLGVGGPNAVSPYESAIVSERGLLFQEPTERMSEMLASLGLSVADNCGEPSDHLSVELSVQAQLVDLGSSDQGAFARHLLTWVPEFCHACIVSDGLGFYAGAARVLEAFLGQEIVETSPHEPTVAREHHYVCGLH